MAKLKPRQRQILAALVSLGGEGSTREIAEKAGLSPNGVAQTLGSPAFDDIVEGLDGKAGDYRWKLRVR